MDCLTLSGFAMTLKKVFLANEFAQALRNAPERILRLGYTTPYPTGYGELLPYSLCLKVSSFQMKNKSDTLVSVCNCSCSQNQSFLDIKKAWSWMHLPSGGLDCPNTISTNYSRPKRPLTYRKTAILAIDHIAKRCGRHMPVADVSVRLILRIHESV